jgi:hypothetical protein
MIFWDFFIVCLMTASVRIEGKPKLGMKIIKDNGSNSERQ